MGGYGHNGVHYLSDLVVFVGTLEDEAKKLGKGDCEERLQRNTAIHAGQVSVIYAGHYSSGPNV